MRLSSRGATRLADQTIVLEPPERSAAGPTGPRRAGDSASVAEDDVARNGALLTDHHQAERLVPLGTGRRNTHRAPLEDLVHVEGQPSSLSEISWPMR